MSNCYFDTEMRYVQAEYGRQPTFSSFLPGIAGPWGIPAWCNYNNRGQAVCSFGVQDKDHAILEFTAASTAYQRTALTGFRTFIKHGGKVVEPFADGTGTMIIESNVLGIRWADDRFDVEVQYFTLPNERMAGLCRRLNLTNVAKQEVRLELLDGLATIVPYGINDEKLKQEANLSIAWMQVDNLDENLPCFRVRASLEDTAKVTAVEGCNFRLSLANGKLLPAIVQPSLVYGWDTSLVRPASFENCSLDELMLADQLVGNYLPCCMTPWTGNLNTGETLELWEFYGQADHEEEMNSFCLRAQSNAYFERKLNEARLLAEQITEPVKCQTANPIFDRYVAQNFLDNVMRGGLPYNLDGQRGSLPIYLYSRKHGDPEREYNYFALNREYFSQGNAHFRDICQNRRSDVMIHPKAGAFNLQLFFELIQADGYNPLVLEPVSYVAKHPDMLISMVENPDRKYAKSILNKPFSFGQLAMAAEHWNIPDLSGFLTVVIEDSEMEPNATFQEGYWSDHWTYILDLLETEFAIFPDKEYDLLFGEPKYRWFARHAVVKPQAERYCVTENGVRQYNCIRKEETDSKWMRTKNGDIARSNLFEKLLLLCAVKSATLDLSGAAVEMEGGKPGWYDALNGLPGLLGASLADGCELLRVLDYLLDRIALFPAQIELYEEVANLFKDVANLAKSEESDYDKWIARNTIRDQYRAQTKHCFSGVRIKLPADTIIESLDKLAFSLRKSIDTSITENNGICPTYFYYEVDEITEVDNGIIPKELRKVTLPLFLEGPARWLRTKQDVAKKKQMVEAVCNSALVDPKLQMYKLNASLSPVSYEVGRTRAFPAGWLENESIWLHMEYKYLLSLLECRLYDQFFGDFKRTAIPFLSPDMYKRSTLENSSFLLSSVNPDGESHGRGYVSRLSGSTAEFISIWNQMLFGKNPFTYHNELLTLHFCPAIPEYLISGKAVIGTFLGKVTVEYHTGDLKELKPGEYKITKYLLDQHVQIPSDKISSKWAKRIREGKVNRIDVFCARA